MLQLKTLSLSIANWNACSTKSSFMTQSIPLFIICSIRTDIPFVFVYVIIFVVVCLIALHIFFSFGQQFAEMRLRFCSWMLNRCIACCINWSTPPTLDEPLIEIGRLLWMKTIFHRNFCTISWIQNPFGCIVWFLMFLSGSKFIDTVRDTSPQGFDRIKLFFLLFIWMTFPPFFWNCWPKGLCKLFKWTL